MKKQIKWTLRAALVLGAVGTIAFTAHNLPASYVIEGHNTSVEIDGTNFGSFDKIIGLDQSDSFIDVNGNKYSKITLRRDFVTDPSLYLWAKNTVELRKGLKDIHLVKRSKSGLEETRYVLRLCQPLSWAVEAANPALGGFHETVDLAVQTIEIR